MEGNSAQRSRGRSDATMPDRETATGRARAGTNQSNNSVSEPTQETRTPRRGATSTEIPPTPPMARVDTSLSIVPSLDINPTPSLRRRNTKRSDTTRRASIAGARSNNFILAGPDETSKLRETYEPYVHPGYATLNPAYEQAANARPVWSLAKPLPRVIRPGMVPTKSEVQESKNNAELPGEHSQKLGLDVDPSDLEKGEIKPSVDPRKLSAQLKDSRLQRENTFLGTLQRYGSVSRGAPGVSRAGSLTSSARRRRASTSAARRPSDLSAPTEAQEDVSTTAPERPPSTDETKPQQMEDPSPLMLPRRPTELHTIPESRPVSHIGPIESPMPEEQDKIPVDEDDGASMTTLDAEEEPQLWEDMAPLMENFIEDEVHNNHTSWSVVRTQHREFLAELLGVYTQLTLGFCSDVQATLSGASTATPWAWGLATMTAIYVSGGISGAHLNPTVTLALWFFRGFPKRKLPAYLIAQFLGAFLAALTAYGVYATSIHAYKGGSIVNDFVTNPRYSFVDGTTAFFNEFLGTAFLLIAILALGDDQNAPPGAGMNALIIGLVIVLLNFTFTYQTGFAGNPSRDLGPRVALLALGYRNLFNGGGYWVYGSIMGPLAGAVVGALVYDVAVFTGGESPVNYPWSRTKRAVKKSGRKWKARGRRVGRLVGRREKGGMGNKLEA